MKIAHNIEAMNSYRNLMNNKGELSQNLEKLSSGYKINRAGDDAAGLAISEKMRAQITGLTQGTENAEHGTGLVRTAEAAMDEIHAMLNRMLELSVQSANGTYDNEVDRVALQKEVVALVSEVGRIVESTNYNGIPLLTRDYISTDWLETVREQVAVLESYDYFSTDLVEEVLDPLGKLESTSYRSYQACEISNNMLFSSNLSVDYSTTYRSSTVSVPPEVVSVSGSIDFPYEIEMIVTVYNDETSTDSNSDIMHQVVTLVVDKDASGQLAVWGKTEAVSPGNLATYDAGTAGSGSGWTNFYGKTYSSTNKDQDNAGAGNDTSIYFVAEKEDGASQIVTAGEMQRIMEDLLNTLPYSVSSGGYDASNTSTTMYSRYTQQFNDAGFYYNSQTGRWTYPSSGAYAGTTTVTTFISDTFTSTECGYGVTGNTSTYGSIFGESIYFCGNSSLQTGRVLGCEFTVTQNGTGTTSEYPKDFDPLDWNSASLMTDLADRGINVLGVAVVAEPSHSHVTINPNNILSGAEVAAMSEDQFQQFMADYLLHITKVTTNSNNEEEIVTKEASYALLYGPADAAVEAKLLANGVEAVVWATEGGETYRAINELCLAIENSSELSVTTANRMLDQISDVALDDNESNLYTIELAVFTQTVKTYGATTHLVTEGWTTKTEENLVWESKEVTVSGIVPDPIVLQVGDDNIDYDRIYVYIENMRKDVEDLENVDISKQDGGAQCLDLLKAKINQVSSYRGDMGAYDNRLQHTINANRITLENLQASESKIRDTDFAEEMMDFTKNNILLQSAQSMLAQANQLPQGVLSLLQ